MTPLMKLQHFLLLGISPRTDKCEHIDSLESCLQDEIDRDKIVDVIKNILSQKLDFCKDTIIHILARCCTFKDDIEFRKRCYSLMLDVCQHPKHLFLFLTLYKKYSILHNNSSGWNKIHKTFICLWYIIKPTKELVSQCTRYRSYYGWTNGDVLRLCHIKPHNPVIETILGYVVNGQIREGFHDNDHIQFLKHFDTIQTSPDKYEIINKIRQCHFQREHIPKFMLLDKEVADVLIECSSLNEMIYNIDIIKTSQQGQLFLHNKLMNYDNIINSKISPLEFLLLKNIDGFSFQLKHSLELAFRISVENYDVHMVENTLIYIAQDIIDIKLISYALGLTYFLSRKAVGLIHTNFNYDFSQTLDYNITNLFNIQLSLDNESDDKYKCIVVFTNKPNFTMNNNTKYLYIHTDDTYIADDSHYTRNILHINGLNANIVDILQYFLQT